MSGAIPLLPTTCLQGAHRGNITFTVSDKEKIHRLPPTPNPNRVHDICNGNCFTRVGVVVKKSTYWLRRVRLSVRLFACFDAAPRGQISMKIDIKGFHKKNL